MYVLIDTSAILKKSLFAGKDLELGYEEQITNEEGEIKTNWINSAEYGFDIATGMVKNFFAEARLYPKDAILVLEGVNGTKFRKGFYPDYKSGRPKSPAILKEYNKLEAMFVEAMLSLGAQVATHPGVEADDLIGWIAENIKEPLWVWTIDGDLAVLRKHANVNTHINGVINSNPFGDFPCEFIDVYKSTVGDSSDKIKGAPGFGKKAFDSVYATWGDTGLANLRQLIETRSLVKMQEDVATCPALQKLIDNAQSVELSYKCAKLHTEMIQQDTIEWQHGMNAVKEGHHPNLRHFAQEVVGVTQSNFVGVFTRIKQLAQENPLVSLDIETSTPEESDEWIEQIVAVKGKKEEKLVDVFGSELVSLQITLGGNFQYTFDFSVNHAETNNVTLEMVEQILLYLNPTHRFIIQNVNFELPVLKNTYGWFLRDVDDTQLMASYVDENSELGLKKNSPRWLNYTQTTYEELVGEGSLGAKRKMNDLTLAEAISYAADDTICTAALYQWYKLHMLMENVWDIYRKVEIGACFWTAQAYLDGLNINLATLAELSKRDEKLLTAYQDKIFEFLVKVGWEGTVFKPLTLEDYQTPDKIKYAYKIVTGEELKTRKRKFEAILGELQETEAAELVDILKSGNIDLINQYLGSKFVGKPDFNFNSTLQVRNLLYNVLGLPERLFNDHTETQIAKGELPTAKTNNDALELAILYDAPKDSVERMVLENLVEIKGLLTRFSLFYKTYSVMPHWKDGKIHSSLNQCATNTRRFSSSKPNIQQFSKNKGDIRKVVVPHNNQSMIVSLDFSAQELRIIADLSQDKNMLSCYIGDDLKDMHSITAAKISGMDYAEFRAIQLDENHPRHTEIVNLRKLAKTVNFGTQYGMESKKLAISLRCSQEEAQGFINAKDEAFRGAEIWKDEVTKQASLKGYSLTMLGARRHLTTSLNSSNSYEASKAERQAVNFVVQGSAAEMTKLAMGRMFQSGMREKYDMRFLATIHDEIVMSINIKDMPEVIPQVYAAMTAPYANMKVPLQSSVSIGWNFGDQHELGDNVVPTPENISEFINKITQEDLQAA